MEMETDALIRDAIPGDDSLLPLAARETPKIMQCMVKARTHLAHRGGCR